MHDLIAIKLMAGHAESALSSAIGGLPAIKWPGMEFEWIGIRHAPPGPLALQYQIGMPGGNRAIVAHAQKTSYA